MFIVGRKVVPGTGGKPYDVNLVMLEGGAKELGEEDIVQGINLALESMRPVMELQDEMQKAIGKAKRAFTPPVIDEALYQKISGLVTEGFKEAYGISEKLDRYGKLRDVREKAVETLCKEDPSLKPIVEHVVEKIDRGILRNMILSQKRRVGGRAYDEIRADQLRGGTPSPHARLGPLHAGRDPGPGDDHPGDLQGRAENGLHHGRREALLHAALQLSALQRG